MDDRVKREHPSGPAAGHHFPPRQRPRSPLPGRNSLSRQGQEIITRVLARGAPADEGTPADEVPERPRWHAAGRHHGHQTALVKSMPGALNGAGPDLQELVLESLELEDFLTALAAHAATLLSPDSGAVSCGLTVTRPKKAPATAGSNPGAYALEEIQARTAHGPSLTAIREQATVHIPDLKREETRWPQYTALAAGHGLLSVLAIPLPLDGDARAALSLYSAQAAAFTGKDIDDALGFAGKACTSLKLALRITRLTDVKDHMAAAMETRTTIDTAIGALMAQNRCNQTAAMTLLKRASNNRNIKLHDLASAIITSIAGDTHVTTHFDD
ncbi:ANTAR domain-containing protein [Arthrobacter sp. 92]|uniref:ANTAR domain-containing protein n=1 Tax=Arthrobacter sp. 92 TaxID=3418175 RepID=UPI003D001178